MNPTNAPSLTSTTSATVLWVTDSACLILTTNGTATAPAYELVSMAY